jgi:hypothetical protein
MRTLRLGAAALLVLAACVACSGDGKVNDTAAAMPASASTASTGDRAGTAANVANAIRANPAAADSILTANGFTRDSFEELMYEIAADSALSATYAAAHAP